MANLTTTSIESKTKITPFWEVKDFFFIIIYCIISYVFSAEVHDWLHIPFAIFTLAMATFLTAKSGLNKNRRNIEGIYFLIKKDISVYRPYIKRGDNEDVI